MWSVDRRAGMGAAAAGLLLVIMPQSAVAHPAPEPDQTSPAEELAMLNAAEVVGLDPDEALDARHIGERVRWAGGVYAVDGRCLTVNFARSGAHGEPRWTAEPTYQAFVACGPGPYDAELVRAYTNVTIIGRITGKKYIGMGGGGSEGPAIAIDHLYRWSDCLAGDASPVCRQGFVPAGPVPGE